MNLGPVDNWKPEPDLLKYACPGLRRLKESLSWLNSRCPSDQEHHLNRVRIFCEHALTYWKDRPPGAPYETLADSDSGSPSGEPRSPAEGLYCGACHQGMAPGTRHAMEGCIAALKRRVVELGG